MAPARRKRVMLSVPQGGAAAKPETKIGKAATSPAANISGAQSQGRAWLESSGQATPRPRSHLGLWRQPPLAPQSQQLVADPKRG